MHTLRALILIAAGTFFGLAALLGGIVLRPDSGLPQIAMSPAQIEPLLQEASQLSGIPINPNKPIPPVVSLPQKDFDKLMCGDDTQCHTLAVYTDDYNLIIVGDKRIADLNSVYGQAVLIHELTHYLSQMPKLKYTTVAGCTEEENRAYDTERKYLIKHGGDPSKVMDHSEVFLVCVSRFGM